MTPGWCLFLFDDLAATALYTLSLHDALPIFRIQAEEILRMRELTSQIIAKHTGQTYDRVERDVERDKIMSAMQAKEYGLDRKSTRLNSSHSQISYAVFCLKKKKAKTSLALAD